MNEQRIKDMIYGSFKKWYSINYWFKEKDTEPTEEEVKRYLGYFGINNRVKR